MRILFTADWHLKLGQKNVPLEWAVNRYNMFFSAISGLERDVDLHIIGGDLFDRLPTLPELNLFFSFIGKVSIPTIIFDGNHEATKKNETFLEHLREVVLQINEKVDIVTESRSYDTLSILPYKDLHKKNSIESLDKNKILFTHVRGEIPPHVTPEVCLDRFSEFPIVFAGDLHAHSNSQRNIVYPGSPMTTSFHRSEVSTGYIILDDESHKWAWKPFELPQLLRKTVTDPKDMEPSSFHHTIYELEGDITELAKVSNSELLDKKVVKRASEASLLLNKEMGIADELTEYLQYILEIPEEKIYSIMGTFYDYTKGAELE